MNTNKKLITSESVTAGHPDKVADQISDALLDAFLKQDKESHVAVECLTTTGMVLVAGEVTTTGYVDIQKIVRETLKGIGYTKPEYGIDYEDCAVLNTIHEQSQDINQGTTSKLGKKQGAGDQGIVYGYACDETPELMPMPIMIAHALVRRLAEVRQKNILTYLRPDGKSQVSIEYHNGIPTRAESIVMAVQHDEDIELEKLRNDIYDQIIEPECNNLIDESTKIIINGTGKFVKGGPEADTGLTGRKIIVDTYGGVAHHGGGAFSGKSCDKVDRSGAYAARQVAKSIVANSMADKCEVAISYAIGVAKPTSINFDTFGTEHANRLYIERWVMENFDLTPYGIINGLDLKRPIYKQTAAHGHFGRNEFPWEKVK